MAKALKCDRCGRFFDYIKYFNFRKYQIHDMDEKNFNKTIDLCPDCYAELLLFLNLDNDNGSGEFESRHYEFEDCDNIKGERVIKCREESDGSSGT